MTMISSRMKPYDHRRRGSVYLAVLGVAVIVMVLGTSALLAVRVQSKIAGSEQDAIKAGCYAQSFADLAQWRVASNPLWRSAYTNNAWTYGESNGEGVFSYKIADEVDGSLTNNASDPVRLYAKATVGNAVRIYSVSLQPGDPMAASKLSNPGFESGTSSWSGSGCTLTADASNVRTGGGALLVSSRSSASSGPQQSVSSFASSGTNYTTEVWVKMASGTANVRVTLKTTTILLLSTTTAMTPWTTVGTSWTRVSGTATPTWLNLLSSATLYIETQSGTTSLRVDDFNFFPTSQGKVALAPVAGSWRQETLP